MVQIAVVGCTGKLGSAICKNISDKGDAELRFAIARRGNQFVGKYLSEMTGSQSALKIIDE